MDIPGAFMSYAQGDDRSARGQLTTLRKELSEEIHTQTGSPFQIFQDREGLEWGQHWQSRIEQALDGASFLIAVVTPRFFQSDACIHEVMTFAHREKELGRRDLVLPLLFVDTKDLVNSTTSRSNVVEVDSILTAHQYADWRDFRDRPLRSPKQRRALKELARQVVLALKRPSTPTVETDAIATVLTFPPRRPIAAPISGITHERLVRTIRATQFDQDNWMSFALANAHLVEEIENMNLAERRHGSKFEDLLGSLSRAISEAGRPSSPTEFRAAAARVQRIRGWILDALPS